MNALQNERSLARGNVLGVSISITDYTRATDLIIAAAREQRPFGGTALAVHGVMTGHNDLAQRTRINALDLVTPDGQPVRWALNWLHHARLADRVYGPFLMMRVCERAAAEGLSLFLYGSDASTLSALETALRARFPALRIAGTRPSRFRPATEPEWREDAQMLRDSRTDIVFCGLGCPRQETWVYEMRPEIDRPLIAVGAAFAFWAGRQPMAPAWMQRNGLEWLFRLGSEPRRLAGRYLINNPVFVAKLTRQKIFGDRVYAETGAASPPKLRFS
jgi:exopolysaccharide biosynthesis WecB/TagA/CpsF family protein